MKIETHHWWSISYIVLAEDQGNKKLFPFAEKGIIIETFIYTELKMTKIFKNIHNELTGLDNL